jgi:hypothetical protein
VVSVWLVLVSVVLMPLMSWYVFPNLN